MKLLIDQNLSPKLVETFSDKFENVLHTQDAGLERASDIMVWEFAKEYEYTIITKDSDFNNIVTLMGFPPKVVWIKKGNCSAK